ncbi:MAG TPA: dienelactone hydrolase family protein [Bradyrhizobium sp.]|nr:dienelactone hydrolase family protein [Bradyrhizobium sp.]
MPPGFLRISLIAFALALAPAAAAQQAEPDAQDKRALETVHFASLDGKTNLTAYLGRHPGDAPRPAVVLMHGCSGLLNANGRIFPIYRTWMRALFAKGYDVLTVDSAASRGFGQTCSPGPNRITMWRDRPSDAYAALGYLQAQPSVRADRIALMGWSQGGGAVLLTINDKSIGRPAALSQDFVTAVAFYPGVCNDKFQSKPWTQVEPQGWTTQVPLLVLFGAADTWTPLAPCEEFLGRAKARGNPVELKIYANAVHAFDAPNLPRTELPAYRNGNGPVPVIGTDEEARADAFPRVLEFLKLRLETN